MPEKCLEMLESAKEDLMDVEGSEDAIAKIDEAISSVKELYPEDSMDNEEKAMQDSGKYQKGKKSGIMLEISFNKNKKER